MFLSCVTVRALLAKYEEVLPKNKNSEGKFLPHCLLVPEGAKKYLHSPCCGIKTAEGGARPNQTTLMSQSLTLTDKTLNNKHTSPD